MTFHRWTNRSPKVKIPSIDEAFLLLAAHEAKDKESVVRDVCGAVPHAFDERVLRCKLDGLFDKQLLRLQEVDGTMQLTHVGVSTLVLLRAQMSLLDKNLAKILG